MSKKITVMVGPAGSGKSTLSRSLVDAFGYTYINQDAQGRQHLQLFDEAIARGENIVVDRMGFTKQQRDRYLVPAKQAGYETNIMVLHQPYKVCLERCMARVGHETISDEKAARGALNMFFSKYERVQDNEADLVQRFWPDGFKPIAVVSDLDGTLCNVDHRLHHMKVEGKKDWNAFFKGMSDDTVNQWCSDLLTFFAAGGHKIVLCSGRPDDWKRDTVAWLKKHRIEYDDLFMRLRSDSRKDNIAKEVILDFEILTRYTPYFMVDDRQQVVDMWRSRGYTCLQCEKGDF